MTEKSKRVKLSCARAKICYAAMRMEITQLLQSVCYDEQGALKKQNECRAAMINHLILEDGMGVDEAEDIADKTLRESGFWPVPTFDFEDEATDLSTPPT